MPHTCIRCPSKRSLARRRRSKQAVVSQQARDRTLNTCPCWGPSWDALVSTCKRVTLPSRRCRCRRGADDAVRRRIDQKQTTPKTVLHGRGNWTANGSTTEKQMHANELVTFFLSLWPTWTHRDSRNKLRCCDSKLTVCFNYGGEMFQPTHDS